MDLGIAGRRAAVAAGTAGLGLATARALAEEGVHVAVCGRDTDRLAEALAVLGPRAVGLVADMSAAGGPEEFAAGAVERLGGPIDIVVANAGVGYPTPAQTATWPMVERMLDVNVMGAAATITAVLPQMIARGHGTVAGVSSLAAWRGLGGFSSYSASKAFLSTFLESLRVDVHGTGVKVVCIEPGFVKTAATDRMAGAAPMPFMVPVDAAAAKIGRALIRGTRVLTFPLPLVVGSAALRLVPAAIYEPIGKRASLPQLAMLAAEAKKP